MGELNAETGTTSGPDEPLRLAPKLDLRASMELIDALRARRGADLTLDAGDVQHIGAHAAQTLLVAAENWARDGNRITLDNLQASAIEQLSVMGLDPEQFSGGAPAWA